MENLHIKATRYTPEIHLTTDGVISLKGKSYPENTFEFYTPMMLWVKEFLENVTVEKIVVNMEIIYFNSSSSKLFFDFFDLLEENVPSHAIEINWIYDEENESALEAGEDFIEDFVNLKINLISK
ncbi:MAG: DUF1987 domain-containing protein [Epsilonproteobacteria bacterium]|nr:DUF1987 domain-containing protein [Campylobacterota bacterium]